MVVSTTRFYRLRAWPSVPRLSRSLGAGLLLLLGPTGIIEAQAQLLVTSTTPAANQVAAARTTNVAATFNQPLSNTPATQGALKVFSQQAGGRKVGTVTATGSTLIFDPTTDFKAGETVFGTITTAVQSSGTLASPKVFQFTTATSPSTGTFGAPQTLATKESTSSLAVGDVNGDGYPDLLTANSSFTPSSTVSVRLNNRQGGFGNSVQEITAGPAINDITLGDFDGDGDLDLVTANFESNTISLLFNNGSGFFSGLRNLSIDVYLKLLAAGDLDGDGDLDLVVANTFGNVFFRLNNGNDTFDEGSSVRINGNLRSLKLADIDNDGDLDLATFATLGGDFVALLRNNGSGSFSATDPQIEVNSRPFVGSPQIDFGDADGDGDLDLATSRRLFVNAGNGTFTGTNQLTANGSLFGDVDGDGDLDLVLPAGSALSVQLNNGSGVFSQAQQLNLDVSVELALADLDGNNTLDLAAVGLSSTSVLLNQPTASSAVPTLTSVSPSISPVGSSVVLTGTNFTGATRVAFNGVASTFVVNSSSQITATVPAGATSGLLVVTTASGSSNGLAFTVGARPTVVSTSPTSNTPSASRTTPVAITFNQPLLAGSGIEQALNVFSQQAGGKKAGTRTISGNTLTFTPVAGFKAGETVFSTVTTPASMSRVFGFTAATAPSTGTFSGGSEVTVSTNPSRPTTGDIDGDGDLDLLVPSSSNIIDVRLNNGNGTFTNGQTITGAGAVVLADVDGDADLDLLARGSDTGVNVYLNDGNGSFQLYRTATVLGGLSDIAVGDVDADGDLDLITAAYGLRPGNASVRLNDGTGNFVGGQDINANLDRTYRIAVGDLDGDGDLDFMTGNIRTSSLVSSYSVTVYSNNGSGRFNDGQIIELGSGNAATSVVLGDLDKDGDLDFVSTNGGISTGSNQVVVGLNSGNSTFALRQFTAPSNLGEPFLGDVDGDGDLDFTISAATGTLVWLNNGAASFSTTQTVAAIQASILSDIDGDGDLDLLGASGTNSVGIRLNQNTASQPLAVTSLTPARNANAASRTTDVAVTFNQALANTAATQGALKVYSAQAGGRKAGAATISGNTLTLNPTTDFKPGETVFTTVTSAVQSSGGASLAAGQVFQFRTATTPSSGTFGGGSNPTVSNATPSIGDVTFGDVDGDGDLDLLSINSTNFSNPGSVGVRLNDGTGTYGTSQVVPTGVVTQALALGDIDGDGDLDFVTTNLVSPTSNGVVNVRVNNGSGSFSGLQQLPAAISGSLEDVQLGDVDGDGDLDIVIIGASPSSNSAGVLLNDGAGNFSNGSTVAVSPNPNQLELADVDSDGDLDLLTLNGNSSSVSVRRNNGQGSFSGTQEITVANYARGLAVGDVDGDGDLDLLVARYGDDRNGQVDVFTNNGSGSFSTSQSVAVGPAPRRIKLGDIDGDGDLDFVVGNVYNEMGTANNTATVRLNNGNGVFSGNQQVPVAQYPGSLDLGDVDGDGDLDLATANFNGPELSIRLNQNTAQGPLAVVSVAPARNTVAAPRPTDVVVSFNQELANTATTQGALKVYSAQAGGLKAGAASVSGTTLTFNPTADFKPGETVFASILASAQSSGGQNLAKGQVFQFTTATAAAAVTFSGTDVAAGAGANGTALGDLDRDGDLDLLTANTNASSVSVRFNNGNGTFSGTQEVRVDDGPYAIALGDIDRDGDLDFVTANANRRTVSVRYNDGQGSFSGAFEVPVGVSPHAVALGDIDADGDLDLLAANYTDGTDNNQRSTVSVRLNNGFGGFSGTQEVSIGTRPLSLVLGDVDNDGDLDFATANSNSNTASVRLNDGTGTFSGTQDVQVGYQPHGVTLADVDKDGDLDLLAAHLVDSGVSVRLNNGTGTFSGSQEVPVSGARSLATGDVNGDGNLDLLVGNVWGNTVAVRLNSGTGTFTGSLNVPVGTAASDVRVGDLDGNGTLDFVTANANANTASVRLNAAAATAAPAKQVLAYSARRPQELSVYPNPAHDRVQLQLPLDLATQSVQVSVRNSLGQVVLEKTLAPQAEAQLSLANLPTGVYNVQVRSTQGVLSQRLVIE